MGRLAFFITSKLNLKRQQDKMKATTQALRIVAAIALACAAKAAAE